jgi:hypothetical protein
MKREKAKGNGFCPQQMQIKAWEISSPAPYFLKLRPGMGNCSLKRLVGKAKG